MIRPRVDLELLVRACNEELALVVGGKVGHAHAWSEGLEVGDGGVGLDAHPGAALTGAAAPC